MPFKYLPRQSKTPKNPPSKDELDENQELYLDYGDQVCLNIFSNKFIIKVHCQTKAYNLILFSHQEATIKNWKRFVIVKVKLILESLLVKTFGFVLNCVDKF